jgi:hypothetical protein
VDGLVDGVVDDDLIALVADFDRLPDTRPLTALLGRIRLD